MGPLFCFGDHGRRRIVGCFLEGNWRLYNNRGIWGFNDLAERIGFFFGLSGSGLEIIRHYIGRENESYAKTLFEETDGGQSHEEGEITSLFLF